MGVEGSFYTKYSDLIKSQYNYNPELNDSFYKDEEKSSGGCRLNSYPYACSTTGYINDKRYRDYYSTIVCNKLYYRKTIEDFSRYSLSARFLTVLILSLIISLLHCGLAYSGFKLFKETS